MMSEDLAKLAVDAIDAGELNQAGEHLKSALMAKAKEAVDIKRVEMCYVYQRTFVFIL